MKALLIAVLLLLPVINNSPGQRFRQLTRGTKWREVSKTLLQFDAHHPQGMVRIGETFFLSAVEIRERPYPLGEGSSNFDRSPGAGIGHLFKFDGSGRLIFDLRIGEGTIYHPGGIDFDGLHIWVPVAEYRPRGRSIVYRIDPVTMTATGIFHFGDHLGAIVHDRQKATLHAMNWGSRRIYSWTTDRDGRVVQPPTSRNNPSFYIDYQDCHLIEPGRALCGGLNKYGRIAPLSLGGLDLVNLETSRPIHQLPLELWNETGQPMTRNPFWMEMADKRLRFWFLPADHRATLYCYEAGP